MEVNIMIQYRLLTGPDDAEFCTRITRHLNEGWELHGSPALTFNGERVIAAQAVMREVAGDSSAEIVLPKVCELESI